MWKLKSFFFLLQAILRLAMKNIQQDSPLPGLQSMHCGSAPLGILVNCVQAQNKTHKSHRVMSTLRNASHGPFFFFLNVSFVKPPNLENFKRLSSNKHCLQMNEDSISHICLVLSV